MNRRQFIKGALASAFCTAMPYDLRAQTPGYTMNTYPYRPDAVSVPRLGIWTNVNMDVSLLHPDTGAPTIGFYASLDKSHGEPFGPAWKMTYRKYFGSRSVHDQDRGTMIQIVNHIRSHAVTAEQFTQAYHIAKNAWDRNSSLRLAMGVQESDHSPSFG